MIVRAEQNGFTLLELLVSITLLAFLSLAVVSGLRFGSQVWSKSQTANVDSNAVRSAESWIGRSLVRLYPKYVVASPTDSFVTFDGTSQQMDFLSTSDEGLAQVRLEGVKTASGVTLQAEQISDVAASRVTPDTMVLLHQLNAVEFAYYGIRAGEKVPAWHQSWQHERSLPLLIRIRAAMPRPSTSWNELVVRPKIAADVSCNFDAVTRFCTGRL
ncbi:MAG TPA: prepilin-type N-terminal cleavage/methylation domain-containing protein [Candidatus Acidoferrum sp.]|nr:prepilin-type N-terminal cleavage/methylation domain-containing protein [Candidatus Acidoferrum sp.]